MTLTMFSSSICNTESKTLRFKHWIFLAQGAIKGSIGYQKLPENTQPKHRHPVHLEIVA